MSDEKIVIVSKVFDNLKKVTPALLTVALVTGLIIFLPQPILEKMSLDKIPTRYFFVVGLLFLSSASLTLVIILLETITKMKSIYNEKKYAKKLCKNLSSLSKEQKYIISEILNTSQKTLQLDCTSGNVFYLETLGFITNVTKDGYEELDGGISCRYIPTPELIKLYQTKSNLF